MRAKPLSPRHGFSLVELLAFLAIVALALLLALPSLRRAGELSRKARCVANLRQIGAATALYAAENRGRLPIGYSGNYPNAGNPHGIGGDSSRQGFVALLPYLSAQEEAGAAIFHCPSSTQPLAEYLRQWRTLAVLSSSYSQYCGWGPLGGNSGFLVNSRDLLADSSRSRMLYLDYTTDTPATPANHRNAQGGPVGANLLLADGSVSWLHLSELPFAVSRLGTRFLFPDPYTY